MKSRFMLLNFIIITAILTVGSASHAMWVENGIGVCTLSNDQQRPRIIPDGEGGSFIVWYEFEFSDYDIYAQRVDALGNTLWTVNGVPVCTVTEHQYHHQVVSDGAGGIIVIWVDRRNYLSTGDDIYAQRFDGEGNPLWASNGVPVCTHSTDQESPLMVSDGQGGAIIAWNDNRTAADDIIAQRINEYGITQWTADGIQICTYTNNQDIDDMTEDGNGGAVVSWTDFRDGIYADIYAQRILPDGTTDWTTNGRAICSATDVQISSKVIRDISGGFIFTWLDVRFGSTYDIYAQKTDRTGNAQWTPNGEPVCVETGHQEDPQIVSDGAWGAYIVWTDNRSTPAQILGQRMTGAGSPAWGTSGEYISDYTGAAMYDPVLIPDGDGGAIVAWKDYRSGTEWNLFAQKFDSEGDIYWGSYGKEVRVGISHIEYPDIASDGAGGALFAWRDNRNEQNTDIYAGRIERNGYWGYPSPLITDVRDVPGDQGGSVNLKWDASRLDLWPDGEIYNYTAWRAIDESAALALQKSGVPVMTAGDFAPPNDDEPVPHEHGPAVRMTETASGSFYWELIATVGAYELENYSVTVPTLFDSTDVSTEHTYFQVIAHSHYTSIYWISSADSGYSVDNLAPAAPLGLAGEQAYTPAGMLLTWEPNIELDLEGYKIYRGASSGFEPGPGNFVTSTPDTMTLDEGWTWEPGYWYKVSAVDIHGNESLFAVFGPDMVTGDDPMPLPDATFLSQNFPNPFNPNTTIAFGLKQQGHVSLRIYDAAGKLVAGLIDESRPAGSYTAEWNGRGQNGTTVASGVYFYRLITKEFEETKKMILLR